jgi:cyclohexyl-isocyanide hydratase
MTLQIGFLLFPQVQPLDLCGPYDVLASMPDTQVRLVWKHREPVVSATGMLLTPDTVFDDCPPLDVLCVPGGSGVGPLLEDEATLAFVQRQARDARYVTSVCTGALVLGAAGLLRGRRATTHWAFHALLEPFSAVPVHERVVRDGSLITGGGITAGIDFALTLAAELIGAACDRGTRAPAERGDARATHADCRTCGGEALTGTPAPLSCQGRHLLPSFARIVYIETRRATSSFRVALLLALPASQTLNPAAHTNQEGYQCVPPPAS